MGGKTSAKVKNANTKKNYDRVSVFVKKGEREYLFQQAKDTGFDSLNSYINYCIRLEIARRKETMEIKEEEKGTLEIE